MYIERVEEGKRVALTYFSFMTFQQVTQLFTASVFSSVEG